MMKILVWLFLLARPCWCLASPSSHTRCGLGQYRTPTDPWTKRRPLSATGLSLTNKRLFGRRPLLLQPRGGGGDSTAPTNPSGWLGQALACALSYAFYNVCIKKSSATMEPILGGVILQLVAALLGSCLWLARRQPMGTLSKAGLGWAMAAGAAVGAAELLSFVVSASGVDAMQSIPVIIGGSVVFGTLLGRLWLGEVLTPKGWAGVVLIAGGIVLVGMEGGSALH